MTKGKSERRFFSLFIERICYSQDYAALLAVPGCRVVLRISWREPLAPNVYVMQCRTASFNNTMNGVFVT